MNPLIIAVSAIVSLILVVVWIMLPLTVARKFDELIAESRKQTALLERLVPRAPQSTGNTIESRRETPVQRIPGIN